MIAVQGAAHSFQDDQVNFVMTDRRHRSASPAATRSATATSTKRGSWP